MTPGCDLAGMMRDRGLLLVSMSRDKMDSNFWSIYAVFAAPKMPNLRASAFLAG
jgi:hypothetical protein